jgi:hypothetical protein
MAAPSLTKPGHDGRVVVRRSRKRDRISATKRIDYVIETMLYACRLAREGPCS